MNKLEKVISYSNQILENDRTGHDFEHAKRVASWVEKIINEDQLEVNDFVAISSAYLHDVIDDKVVDNVDDAKESLSIFLDSFLTEIEVRMIFSVIENLSFSANLEGKRELSIEGKVVQDADRMDALGAHGILRTAYYGGGHGHPIYDKNISIKSFSDKESYRKGSTVINHFYEKLFLLPDLMNTQTGKREATRRMLFMKEFLDEFYQEMSV